MHDRLSWEVFLPVKKLAVTSVVALVAGSILVVTIPAVLEVVTLEKLYTPAAPVI